MRMLTGDALGHQHPHQSPATGTQQRQRTIHCELIPLLAESQDREVVFLGHY